MLRRMKITAAVLRDPEGRYELEELELAEPLASLHGWAHDGPPPPREEVERALDTDGIVVAVLERFDRLVGLWPDGDVGG